MNYHREDRIREIASRLAAEAGHPPNSDLHFWLKAERLHDSGEGWRSAPPREAYADFMQHFFASFEVRQPYEAKGARFGYTDGDDLGHRFLHAISEDRHLLDKLLAGSARKELFDVSILSGRADFEDMAKRSLLMADTSLLGSDDPPEQLFFTRDDYVDDAYGLMQHTSFLSNMDARTLTGWLDALRPNLERGDIFLLPRTKTDHEMQAFGGDGVRESHLFDAVVKAGKVRSFATEDPTRRKFLTFLAEVPLPTVNDVSLSTFAEVYNDHFAAANHLKEALRERFFELDAAKGGEMAETALLRIGNKLAREVRIATADLRAMGRRGAAQTAGVAIGTAVAVLAAINVAILADAAPLISGAGGLAALYKAIDAHLETRGKREANPFLFVWLLSRASVAD